MTKGNTEKVVLVMLLFLNSHLGAVNLGAVNLGAWHVSVHGPSTLTSVTNVEFHYCLGR